MADRDEILKHIRSHHYHPLSKRRLARFFDVSEEDYPRFRSLVHRLVREGEIVEGRKGKLLPPEEARKPRHGRGRVEGRFSKAARGFGFVIPADETGPTGGEDLHIPADKTQGAVTGDTVLAEVARKTPRGYTGRIVQILERGQTRFVGTYYEPKGPRSGVVRPDGGVLLQEFAAPDGRSAGAKPKDKVVFDVVRYGLEDEPGEAVITEVLGHRGDPGVDTLAVIRRFDLPDEFPEEALEEARAAAERLDDAALEGRLDLTGETIITIDPEDARDYDDAISLAELDGGEVRLGVHIADVAHFVPEGSALDTEARERGTSVYLPTTVVPMLPEVLSNAACSLQEGRVRLTKSVFIRFAPDGEPIETDFANSYIKSGRRLTYKEAMAGLEGKVGGIPEEVVELLRRMEALARRLLERRRRLGYLELDLPEAELDFDDDGRVTGAHPEDTSFSHRIIEMFMVEANEAVARELARRGVPYVRRVHPEPDEEAGEDLKAFARSVGYKLRDPTDPTSLQQLLGKVRGKPEAYGVHLAVLKSLQRAEYSPKGEGHFALGSEDYCHFTSPIRRYPDLTVHRLFDAMVRGKLKAPKGGRKKGRRRRAEKEEGDALAGLAKHCTETERRAEAAERDLTKIKLLEFLQGRIGETYKGVITGVQAFGLFVEIPHLLIDGLVHISELKDDRYRFDRRKWALVGERHERVLRVGTELEVRIAGVDIPRRQLDLEPVEAERKRRKGKKRGKKGRKKGAGKGKSAGGRGRKGKRGKKR
jgi:ribonuclease R